ncbi:hypothetical protein [Leucobacter salsicius]|uniref:hypothetical protein n=1 Tax=Leucobacter salsicius TaxID=664638 RepID=UPI0003465EDD|nr:hypothetical protein [Leucobacter salsicius]
MSAALFQAGYRKQPRTAARRIVWMVVTLVPFGVFAGFMVTGAVANWLLLSRDVPAQAAGTVPTLLDTWMLTAYGVVATLAWVIVLVLGVRRVQEQRARERCARARRDRDDLERTARSAQFAARREQRATEQAAYERRKAARRARRRNQER